MEKVFRNSCPDINALPDRTGYVWHCIRQVCVDNKDGTATHNGTGLMWQLETSGYMDWYAAMSYATSLSLGSYTDWRLPNFDELHWLLYNLSCKNLMDIRYYSYWTSTEGQAKDTNMAIALTFWKYEDKGTGDFPYSNLISKSDSNYVRAVRSAR